MATGKASDFKIYQPQFNGGFIEKTQQNLDMIMGGGKGAITLTSEFLKGDYRQESFYPVVPGLIQRRDTTSVSAVTDLPITQDEFVSVKLARRIGPVGQTMDSWRKIGSDPREMSFVVGQQSADGVLQEKLNTAIAALVGATINYGSAVVYNGNGSTLSHTHLTRGLFKMGDKASEIIAWVMHSKSLGDLFATAIADKVFEVAGVVINSGTIGSLNRPIIVTDSSSLIATAGTPDTYLTLGLTRGAIEIVDSEVPIIESFVELGKENIIGRMQGEYAYNLGLKGYKWDISNGGANPNSTAVALGTNWDAVVADSKSLAGVVIYSW